jgi:hypothetical protein
MASLVTAALPRASDEQPSVHTQSASTLAVVWMVEALPAAAAKTHNKWEPLWHSDCVKLEKALLYGEQHVFVLGAEYSVDVQKRVLAANFWAEPERRVVRGTWFFRSSQGALYPYDEQEAIALEALYTQAPELLKVRTRVAPCILFTAHVSKH